jgi:hypothetical protein
MTASRSTFQLHGSSCSSSWALVRPETMRSRTSVSHAKGPILLRIAIASKMAAFEKKSTGAVALLCDRHRRGS